MKELENIDNTEAGNCAPISSAPSLDTAKYRLYLAPMQLAPEEEDRLLSALWRMMEAFVDYGFGWQPGSTPQRGDDENALLEAITAVEIGDSHQLTGAFDQAANRQSSQEAPDA